MTENHEVLEVLRDAATSGQIVTVELRDGRHFSDGVCEVLASCGTKFVIFYGCNRIHVEDITCCQPVLGHGRCKAGSPQACQPERGHMCFSATASFTVSAVLAAVGAVAGGGAGALNPGRLIDASGVSYDSVLLALAYAMGAPVASFSGATTPFGGL